MLLNRFHVFTILQLLFLSLGTEWKGTYYAQPINSADDPCEDTMCRPKLNVVFIKQSSTDKITLGWFETKISYEFTRKYGIVQNYYSISNRPKARE